MNGRFRTSISGFNRKDVLDYVKQISVDNKRLEEENNCYCQELEDRNTRICELEALLCDCAEKISELQTKYREINTHLAKYSGELNRINADFSKFHDIYARKLDSLCKGFDDTESHISAHTDELATLIDRIEEFVQVK